MRVKDESIFVVKDLATVIDAAPGSKLLRKVIDVLRPERSVIPGEAIELEGHEISKGLFAAELFRNGASAKLVERVIGMAHHYIRRDSQKGCAPGLIGLYCWRDLVFLVRYFPRHAMNELAERLARPYLSHCQTIAEALGEGLESILDPEMDLAIDKPVVHMMANNTPPTHVVLLDLNEILIRARERIEAWRESLPAEFPVDKWLDAAVMASQVRDEVDSVEELKK